MNILMEALSKSSLGVSGVGNSDGSDGEEHDYLMERDWYSQSLSLLQTISILLCNSPEGTLLISQQSVSRLLTCVSLQVDAEDDEESETEHLTLDSLQAIETLINAKVSRAAFLSAMLLSPTDLFFVTANPVPQQ